MHTVGSATAGPGEQAVGRIQVGADRTGAPRSLPVAVINGADSGDTLYMQAASDGDELNGVGVISKVVPAIDPSELSGSVIAVGIVNVDGVIANEHRNPLDNTKTNRTYPGDAAGSVSERLAATTFDIASEADIILDLHQGSTSRMLEECRVRCGPGHRLHEDCLELAKVFDCGYVLDQQGPDGQLARVGPDEGIPTIDPELGGSVGIDPDSVAVGVDGVFNVLRHYGFLPGTVSTTDQIRARSFEQLHTPAAGLVRLEHELGTRIEEGDTVFSIVSVFGEELDRVAAPTDGILWRARRLSQVAVGEYVCSIGTTIDEY